MSDFKQEERLSRQRAAERLIAIAYALTAGGPLELSAPAAAGSRFRWPTSSGLERELKSNGDQAALELELTWTTPEG